MLKSSMVYMLYAIGYISKMYNKLARYIANDKLKHWPIRLTISARFSTVKNERTSPSEIEGRRVNRGAED